MAKVLSLHCKVRRSTGDPSTGTFPITAITGCRVRGGAIRMGNYKLLEYFENDTVQLFDLKKDLGEQRNLADTRPEKVAELRSRLHGWRNSLAAKMNRRKAEGK